MITPKQAALRGLLDFGAKYGFNLSMELRHKLSDLLSDLEAETTAEVKMIEALEA